MNKIRRLLFIIIFVFLSTFIIRADAASLKENMTDIENSGSDVYLIGGTKFHNNYVINAGESAEAGANYVYIQLSVYNKDYDELDRKPKVIYYSDLTGDWYIKSNGELNPIDTEEEENLLEESLVLFFENNEEKIIEFDPGIEVTGTQHEQFDVIYENGKFKIPATTTYFQFFSEERGYVGVDTNYDADENEMIYGDFYIPYQIPVYNYADKDDLENAEIRSWYQTTKEGRLYLIDESELFQSWDEYAVEGYVDEDGNPIDVLSMTFTEGDVLYQKLEKAVIRTGNINYSINNVDKAIEASNESWHASIIPNASTKLVVSKLITLDKENEEMYLDLNGQTLSRDNGKFVLYITGKNSSLNIYSSIHDVENYKRGTIENESGTAITVGQPSIENQNITLNVDSSVEINTKGIGISVIGNGANLNFSGTINLLAEGASGISGRGNKEDAGANINLKYANILSTEEYTYGLYLPHEGNTEINDSYIKTATAIGIKAGKLNINRSGIYSIGTKKEPELFNNGIYSTGDAIYVEMNPVYLDNIRINIDQNSSLNSVNGKPILIYNPNNMTKPIITSDHYNTLEFDGDKTYYLSNDLAVISVNGKNYTEKHIAKAIEESSKDNKAVLVNGLYNLTISEDIIINNIGDDANNPDELYLDLNGNTLFIEEDCYGGIWLKGKNTTLTISNGYLEAKGSASAIISGQKTKEAQNVRLVIEEDVFISAPNYGVNVFGENAALDFKGNISISEDGYGISGTNPWGKTEINIYDKSSISATAKDGFALYLPENGVTNIYGGQLTGASVIGIKLGELNIYGGTLNAVGEKLLPVYPTNNGTESTGDVIFVEINDNYYKNMTDPKIVININDNAELNSDNGEPIFVYNSNSEVTPIIDSTKYTIINEEIDPNVPTQDINGKTYTIYRKVQ
ncbi:MAG: hypothetical protein IJD92_02310 [Bacilli bacterium]|nr:hypothetical protein [Bacilli bacterium]